MGLPFKSFDCGESALLLDFGPKYSRSQSLAILAASERLRCSGLKGFEESIPAVSSLTVFYDPLQLPKNCLLEKLSEVLDEEGAGGGTWYLWELPAIYGGEWGPDLQEVADRARLPVDETIALHASQTYHVYMLGFAPGFTYMGDLPQALRLPRRATPRARVPKGSVAIASDMTAVYPLESPGGWHLIGSTPIELWNVARRDEPLLKPGDRVRFKPIHVREAEEIRARVAEGWEPEPVEQT
jgi:KipI family sensor histidine kinase inhibitor